MTMNQKNTEKQFKRFEMYLYCISVRVFHIGINTLVVAGCGCILPCSTPFRSQAHCNHDLMVSSISVTLVFLMLRRTATKSNRRTSRLYSAKIFFFKWVSEFLYHPCQQLRSYGHKTETTAERIKEVAYDVICLRKYDRRYTGQSCQPFRREMT